MRASAQASVFIAPNKSRTKRNRKPTACRRAFYYIWGDKRHEDLCLTCGLFQNHM